MTQGSCIVSGVLFSQKGAVDMQMQSSGRSILCI